MKITPEHEPLGEGTYKVNIGGAFAKITPTTNDIMSALQSHGQRDKTTTQTATEPKRLGPLKVAIIGTAPSSRDLAPFSDTSWEIWGTSPGNMNILPRIDRWIEVHSNLLWPENKHYGEPYLKWLNEQSFPVYMQDQSLVPRAITIKKDELVEKYGPYFFTSTFSWAMAMAIEEGCSEMALYGVDMASRDEYILQRPGGQYFVERARQKGINVIIPPESDLAQPPPLYGFSHSTNLGRKVAARKSEINSRLASMTAQRDQLEKGITYLQGAKEDIEYIESIWT